MKILKDVLTIILIVLFFVIVWLLVLPFAILATPFITLSKTLGVEDSGYESLIGYYKSLWKILFVHEEEDEEGYENEGY
jgi:hypothetical protein